MKMETKQTGMSRAAKKRRKKSPNPAVDDSNVAVDYPAESDVEDENPNDQQKVSICEADFSNISILRLLKLKEVSEIDSKMRASSILGNIISPNRVDLFYNNFFEKTFCHFQRENPLQFKGLFSRKGFNDIVESYINYYKKDIIVSNDEPDSDNENSNGEEKELQEIKPKEVMNKLKEGHSVQLLCPQKYNDTLWRFLSALEHEFDSRVECRAQCMPPASHGFSRRRLQAESFVLQLEGSTTWNLQSADLNSPPVDVLLHQGDSLYIPKYWFFKEASCGGESALFLQLCVNEENNTAKLLDLLMPQAVAEVAQSNTRSLPQSFISYMGIAYSENDEDSRRNKFASRIKLVMNNIVETAMGMLDVGVDQMAKSFLMERLPVPLTAEEEAASVSTLNSLSIQPFSVLRMLRPGIARAVVEDGMIQVYHCMDNSRELFGAPIQPLEFDLDDGPAIEALLHAYPMGISVSELPHPSEEMEDKIGVAQALFKEGFLIVQDLSSMPDQAAATAVSSDHEDNSDSSGEEELIEDDVDDDDDDDDDEVPMNSKNNKNGKKKGSETSNNSSTLKNKQKKQKLENNNVKKDSKSKKAKKPLQKAVPDYNDIF